MITGLITDNSAFNGIFSQAGLEQKMPVLRKRFPQFDAHFIEKVSQFDPTKSKKYLAWILKLTANNKLQMFEDADKVYERLEQFDQLKRKGGFKGEKDINKYTEYGDLARVVDDNLGVKTKGEEYRENLTEGMDYIYNDGVWAIIKITTPEAAAKLCRGTDWCVKDPRYSKEYLKSGPLYRFEESGTPFALLHFETKQLMDVYDSDILDNHDLETDELYNKVHDMSQKIGGVFTLKYNVVFENQTSELTLDKIDLILGDPQLSYVMLRNNLRLSNSLDERVTIRNEVKPYFKQLKDAVAKNSITAKDYAGLIGKRFLEGEAAIAKDPEPAWVYWRRYFRWDERWEEAEPALAQRMSYPNIIEYAVHAVKAPWDIGERKLVESDANSFVGVKNYATQVTNNVGKMSTYLFNYINSDAPLKEDGVIFEIMGISTQTGIQFPYIEKKYMVPKWISSEAIINYCRKMKIEFDADLSIIEDNIKDSPFAATQYAREVLNKQRFLAAEPAIIKGLSSDSETVQLHSVFYILDVAPHPWPEAEPAILATENEAFIEEYMKKSGKWADYLKSKEMVA